MANDSEPTFTIPGYAWGRVPRSPVSMEDLRELKFTLDFTERDHTLLRRASEVITDMLVFIVPVTQAAWPLLQKSGLSADEIDQIHVAWTKAVVLSVTLWTAPYAKEGLW